jgi:hypothetical protein
MPPPALARAVGLLGRLAAARKKDFWSALTMKAMKSMELDILFRSFMSFMVHTGTGSAGPSLRGLFAPSCGHEEAQEAQDVFCSGCLGLSVAISR